MPKFYCFNCSQHIDADESLAGTMATCPSCQIKLYVPGEPSFMTDSPSVPTVNPSLRPFSSISDESIQNQHDIASRLLKIGRVHLNINPGIVPHMVSMLNGMGYKKRIWQSPDQFISHCASSYNEALYTLLELTLLSGPQMSDGCYECWYGNGEYAGKLSFSQRLDFQKHANNKIFVVIDIQFFVAQMSVLLAAGSCGGVSRHE